jgi:hypothetical protein
VEGRRGATSPCPARRARCTRLARRDGHATALMRSRARRRDGARVHRGSA